ncbi:MAG TPA: hypothetical protein VI585_25055 [Candidatus Binatia bacterium]
MAALLGTPARSKFLTAVRRKSCGILAGNASQLAGGPPCFSEPFDWLAFAMEQPRNDYAFFSLERLCLRYLSFEHLAKPGSQWKHATLIVLCLSWVQPQPASLDVSVMTMPREQLTRHPPASYIGRFDHFRVILRQMLEHSLELVMLEETFAGVAQSRFRQVGFASHFPRPHPQREHPAQGRLFGVDCGARSLLFLSLCHVSRPPVAGYLCYPIIPEELAQVIDGILDTGQRLAPVGCVVITQHSGHVVKCCLLNVWPDRLARRYLAVALLQQLDGIVPVAAVAAVLRLRRLSDEFAPLVIGNLPVRGLLWLARFSVAPCGLEDTSEASLSLHRFVLLPLR